MMLVSPPSKVLLAALVIASASAAVPQQRPRYKVVLLDQTIDVDSHRNLRARVSVMTQPDKDVELTVKVFVNSSVKWQRSVSISNGPIAHDVQEQISMKVENVAGGKSAKLIVIQAPIPDWEQAILWSVSASASEPVVLRHRDVWSEISSFRRDSQGAVIGFDLYDRWIGRESHSKMRPSKEDSDRIERVSRYLPTDDGIQQAWWRDRQVPHFGGGVREPLFTWISERIYVDQIGSRSTGDRLSELDILRRFHPKVDNTPVTTGPEHVERVILHSFVFSSQAKEVLKEVRSVLLTRNGWREEVSDPNNYIVFSRRNTYVAFYSYHGYHSLAHRPGDKVLRIPKGGCTVHWYRLRK